MKNTYKALLISGALLTSGYSQAEILFNGFASVVGGVTSSDESLYGYDDSIDFAQGSLFALQASADLSDGLSVTAQILSRGEEDWDPKFEWAYVAYDASDNLRILAGRQRVPFYMYSDFLDVSYAYPWITPPTGVYTAAFDTFDGLGAIYTGSLGSFDTSFHFVYGKNSDELSLGGENISPDFNDLVGLSFTLTRDWLTLRAGYIQAEMNIPISSTQPLIVGWESAGFTDIADNILIEGDTGAFAEVGFQVDYNNILVVGEFTRLTLDGTTLGDADSYYLLAGYRFDSVLAHITYGADEDTMDRITGGVPSGLSPALDFLINTTNGITDDSNDETNYITLGLRWDFHDSAALKFEYTSYSDDLDSSNDAGLFRTALVTVF